MIRQLFLAALAVALGASGAAASADERSDMRKMAEQHKHDTPAASPAATAEPARPVDAEEVTYGEAAGQPLRGYLAHPRGARGALPAIVVIHEWWGLNDNIRAMTRRLAGEGYLALAVDLYSGAKADNPDAAMKLMSAAMENKAPIEENLRRAVAHLKAQGAPRIGVIGWCFGGGWSLQTALLVPDQIDAAVVYYGRPETDKEKLARLRAPLLGLFGAEDKGIPAAAVREMEATLKQLGKSVDFHYYEGAGHAFANPSGTSYRAEAAEDAWKRTTAFFKQRLQGKG
jgi:carboxymethylenebutenolidase